MLPSALVAINNKIPATYLKVKGKLLFFVKFFTINVSKKTKALTPGK
jgi:hypothetical protein